ncbi:uncharacterized protein MKK02DRAFT_38581 [Dioszegia hungarica]|uniref:Uncharacterized protein n=1 Tax=Dioszegia hungarica TaxID=4972 RepID=A0AA38H7S9_9TREE|nr:uncharacterized protein MKK02DRAFT_38581 [Dioszegia hungarica]KAI9633909.1 hypothetical protein MKK02DRAFT_38581 [Dioszegia hungarica]
MIRSAAITGSAQVGLQRSPFPLHNPVKRAKSTFTPSQSPKITAAPFLLVPEDVGDVTDVDESRWKEIMLACYPIFFPIYIGVMTIGDRRFETIMEAHDEKLDLSTLGAIPIDIYTARHTPRIPLIPLSSIDPASTLLHHNVPFVQIGTEDDRTSYPIPTDALDQLYTSWISPSSSSAGSPGISPLVNITERHVGPIDWNDARIQSWSGPERAQNQQYAEITAGWRARSQLDALKDRRFCPRRQGDPREEVNVISLQPRWFGLKAKREKRQHKDVLKDLEDAERVYAAIMARKTMAGRRPVPGAKGKK